MSKKVVSVHDVSAVNFIIVWNLFACSMNCSTSSLHVGVPEEENFVDVTFPNE